MWNWAPQVRPLRGVALPWSGATGSRSPTKGVGPGQLSAGVTGAVQDRRLDLTFDVDGKDENPTKVRVFCE
jgi:hypothetical protein